MSKHRERKSSRRALSDRDLMKSLKCSNIKYAPENILFTQEIRSEFSLDLNGRRMQKIAEKNSRVVRLSKTQHAIQG